MKKYDYILVGKRSVCRRNLPGTPERTKSAVSVVEKRNHRRKTCTVRTLRASMSINTVPISSIPAAGRYGDFVNSLAEFNRYTNSPVANYKDEMYNMPFNMNTFSRMWGISTPEEAKRSYRNRERS